MGNAIKNTTLVGMNANEVLPHGPSKMLVDDYLWFSPEKGAIGSYKPTAADVEDHFGVFRGVDQLESFGQLAIVSTCTLLECQKQLCSIAEFKKNFNVVLMAVGKVHFHNFIKEGEVFISVGQIKRYKFRQMEVDGRIYRVPKGFDLKKFFHDFSASDLEAYCFPDSFVLVSEVSGAIGKAIKHSKIN